eukprot:TRINITY_DN5835_c0_g1_i10.p1 TRINITY_DN5835_c0_g1~~TRINITY_DN5835_c0_g1_i10.p1  ORF type:complete len:385 (+),score=61.36 TRINITY_DN5835_c0_g1_i10:127-1155(+)
MRCAARGPATDGPPPRVPGASAAAPRETAEGSAASADFTSSSSTSTRSWCSCRRSGATGATRRSAAPCSTRATRLSAACTGPAFQPRPCATSSGCAAWSRTAPRAGSRPTWGGCCGACWPSRAWSSAKRAHRRCTCSPTQSPWAEVRDEMCPSANRLMLGRGDQFGAARLSFACSTDPAGAAVVTARVVPRQVTVIPVPQERYDRGGFVLFADEGAALADGIHRPAAAERDSSVLVLPTLARAEGAGICKCVLEQGQLPRVRAHLLMSHLQRTLQDACCVPPKGHCGPVFAPSLLPPELGGSDSDLRFGFPASLPRGGLGMRVIDHNRPEQRKSQGETVPPQ